MFQNRARKREREREREGSPYFPRPFLPFSIAPVRIESPKAEDRRKVVLSLIHFPPVALPDRGKLKEDFFWRVGPFAPLSGATLLRTIAGRRTSACECVRQLRLIKEKFFLLLLPPSSLFSRGAIRVPRRKKKSCPAPLFFASVSASRHSSVAQIRPKKECSKNNILLPTTDPAAERR